MRKYPVFFLGVMVLTVCFISLPALAAETQRVKAKASETKAGKEGALATQADLAHMLVEVLGLARFLPANPSDQQCFAILMDNSVFPKGGWQAEKVVTAGDLARVVVQALKKQGEIKNADNDAEWIDYLTKQLGVPMGSVAETLYYVDPLSEPVAPNVVSARTDPLIKRHRFNPVDDTQYGVDMEFIARFLTRFEFTDGEFRPKPVTPD